MNQQEGILDLEEKLKALDHDELAAAAAVAFDIWGLAIVAARRDSSDAGIVLAGSEELWTGLMARILK